MRLSDETLCGLTVIASDGRAIGEVQTLFIASVGWCVESLQVRLRNDIADRIGADRSMFRPAAIEIPTRLVQSVGDAVVLSVAVDELRQGHPATAELAHGLGQ